MKVILRARLDSIRLPSLLQVFVMEQTSVTLEIDTSGCHGQIGLSHGQFTSAHWDRLSGRDAILEMALLSQGECLVAAGTCLHENVSPDLAVDPTMLLLEALRIQDHWQDLATWLLRTENPSPSGWTPFEEHLIGGLSLEETRLQLNYPVVTAFRLAERMLESGGWLRARRRRQGEAIPILHRQSNGPEGTGGTSPPAGLLKYRHDRGRALIALWQSHQEDALWLLDDLVEDNPTDILLKYRWLATRGRLEDIRSHTSWRQGVEEI